MASDVRVFTNPQELLSKHWGVMTATRIGPNLWHYTWTGPAEAAPDYTSAHFATLKDNGWVRQPLPTDLPEGI
jgi:hypothetical protein